jgi:Clp amino terminal domain, pathogenicity island component
MSRGERFTKRAKEIMAAAQAEAESSGNNTVETPHMLLALLQVEGSLAWRVLHDLNMDYDRVLSVVRGALPAEPVPTTPATLGIETRRMLESAMQIARDRRDSYIGSEHVLLALVKGDDKSIRYLMRQINLEPQVVRQNIDRMLEREGGDDMSISDSDPTASQTLRALSPNLPQEFDARARVIVMVESGKISAAEAAELLKAMRYAAVPMTGSSGFVLLPFDQVNFDDLRQRTLRFIVTENGSDSIKAEVALPFEQAQAELFRLLSAIYNGSTGTLLNLNGGDDRLKVSLD